jgi:elongator complex protein 3
MLKIYPTLVLKNTGLYKLYLEKKYSSYSIEEFVDILIEVKKIVPPWVRIMRIQREIETSDIVSGPKVGNLRQMVINELKRRGVTCRCIRCREIGLSNINDKRKFETKDIELHRIEYNSSNGKEIFLSFDTKDNKVIFGFLRLRILSDPQRKELGNKLLTKFVNKMYVSAIVRELHVYGPLVNINSNTYHDSETSNNSNQSSEICLLKSNELYQHKGLGRRLLEEAERICKEEFDINKLSVISAVGTREYYKKFGYIINGPYVTKVL